ncbi:MAG: hypothetical protein ACMX3H_15325 [Sodalis sp. (in: enterobacteria)]|uniref:hypothetical protein n=1 Tax=Sodalis sp. (in: enterobacteria) TaxID=1898979 RepID=UPI0039E2502E
MEHILTGPYNKPTNNSRRPPRGAYGKSAISDNTPMLHPLNDTARRSGFASLSLIASGRKRGCSSKA